MNRPCQGPKGNYRYSDCCQVFDTTCHVYEFLNTCVCYHSTYHKIKGCPLVVPKTKLPLKVTIVAWSPEPTKEDGS